MLIPRIGEILPLLIGVTGALLTLSMVYKGLANLHLDLPIGQALALAGCVGLLSAMGARVVLGRRQDHGADRDTQSRNVERQFRPLLVITACYVSFAHGSNDVANAVGPMAAVVVSSKAGFLSCFHDPATILMALGGVGIVVGLATYGYKVIETIGRKITEVTPSRGFVIRFSTASITLLGSKLGLPVSTTHIIIGAVVGVGFARGLSAVNTGMVRQIVWSWLITFPAAGLLCVVFFHVFRPLFL